METSIILRKADKCNKEVTPKNGSGDKLLKSVIFIFLLSWTVLLSSCFVEGPPRPAHVRQVVIIEHHGQGEHHDNGWHRGHHDQR
jgi:hypothetical protein